MTRKDSRGQGFEDSREKIAGKGHTPNTEGRGRRAEDGGQRTEGGGRRAEGGRQRAEGQGRGGRRTEGRGQKLGVTS